MELTRTGWNRVVQTLQSWRLRLSLILGLRRLSRWKSRLLPLLKAIRQAQRATSYSPQALLALLHLPRTLELQPQTLSWALVTLEDLYLLMLEQETAMEQRLLTLTQPSQATSPR
jgi:hypothetical protein